MLQSVGPHVCRKNSENAQNPQQRTHIYNTFYSPLFTFSRRPFLINLKFSMWKCADKKCE